ncbi:unnamed protein product [Ceratitis capitata]|uniref:(Mediterranean fruit fly) hypothetical protein n=1 Tax=Ceratitis capitata TaxID=7213 RepID=A0A811UQB3_CERCA|nr:unnamed protein product [Ceratitis capitata]
MEEEEQNNWKGKIYWDCIRLVGAPGENIIILKGGDASVHKHPPNRDECEAEVVKANLKRKAEDNPEQPPAQILRLELLQVSPNIFTQVFAVLGLIKKNVLNIDDDTPKDEVALPLVFALFSSKETAQYSAVLRAVERAGQEFNIDNCRPTKVITDFEKGIIIHQLKSFLMQKYPVAFFIWATLAFVPPDNVKTSFEKLLLAAPGELRPVLDYFGETYVIGKPARGRRRGILPRYPIDMWNEYEAALQGSHKTNNVSEG